MEKNSLTFTFCWSHCRCCYCVWGLRNRNCKEIVQPNSLSMIRALKRGIWKWSWYIPRLQQITHMNTIHCLFHGPYSSNLTWMSISTDILNTWAIVKGRIFPSVFNTGGLMLLLCWECAIGVSMEIRYTLRQYWSCPVRLGNHKLAQPNDRAKIRIKSG